LNTPIAILTVTEEAGRIWKSQSGLPPDLASGLEAIEHLLESSIQKEKSTVVIEGIAHDDRFANSPLLCEKGIHSCIGEPLLNRNGKVVGSLLVLDTRTRKISEQEAGLLHAGAKAAVEALEVRAIAPPPDLTQGWNLYLTEQKPGFRSTRRVPCPLPILNEPVPNTAQIDVRLPQYRLREKHRDPPPCDTRSSRSFPATGRLRRLPRTRYKEYKTAGANFRCFLFLTTTDMLFPGTLFWHQSALILPEGHPLVTDQCSRPPVTRSEELEWDRVAMLCWRDADPKRIPMLAANRPPMASTSGVNLVGNSKSCSTTAASTLIHRRLSYYQRNKPSM
jgi:GAF domain